MHNEPVNAETIADLQARIRDLETTVTQQADHIEELETQVEQLRGDKRHLREQVDALAADVTTCTDRIETVTATTDRVERFTQALANKAETNKTRIEELQARELEKGAHLNAENVTAGEVPVGTDHLERITKEGGAYYRVPESEDPLDRGGSVQLATGDLLPIQQLARMDDDMLQSATSSRPARLAVKLWQQWATETTRTEPWQRGSKKVRAYVTASDLRHWIRRQDASVSKEYAQKLVSRVLDAFRELAQHRVYIRKRNQRKNGLQYEERRLILPADAEIPGHTSTTEDPPGTADVHR